MRDGIGNKIHEGSVLFMQQWSVVARVTKIHEGGLSLVSADGKDRGVTPPVMTISIDIPLDPSKVPAGEEIQLTGILCVRDPKSDELVESMMGKKH